jgi:hypothetical protein
MFGKSVATLMVAVLVVMIAPASAGASGPPNHCVTRVEGQQADGQLKMGPERCYATFTQAMAAEHVTAWGEGAAQALTGQAAATFTLAIHYDYPDRNPAGGTRSVVGSSCSGYVNLDTAWNNRISSTANGCPTIRHYDLINKGGASVVTGSPGGNLGTLSNKVSSISYA